jgi:hypothetical protein
MMWYDVIGEVCHCLQTLILDTFLAGHAHLVYLLHKLLNCSADCVENLRTCPWSMVSCSVAYIYVYVINRNVMYVC